MYFLKPNFILNTVKIPFLKIICFTRSAVINYLKIFILWRPFLRHIMTYFFPSRLLLPTSWVFIQQQLNDSIQIPSKLASSMHAIVWSCVKCRLTLLAMINWNPMLWDGWHAHVSTAHVALLYSLTLATRLAGITDTNYQ